MSIEVKVSELPESVADGTLVSWLRQPGDTVKAGEPLAELETDKVVLELFAPVDGVLGPQLRGKGETVRRGDVIAVIDESATVGTATLELAPLETTSSSGQPRKPATPQMGAPVPPVPPAGRVTEPDETNGLAPAVRRLLEEHRLSPADITGSGPRGRITKEDVLRHLDHSPQLTARIGEATPVVTLSGRGAAAESERLVSRPTTRVKMSRLRARIAERMLEAQRSAAILTTFSEVNLQALTDLRQQYRDAFAARHGAKLGIMGFFVRACAEALRRYPIINASIDGDEIVYHGYFDIGVAVSTSRGLVVPILRDADTMSLAEIERAIAQFRHRGEEGKLGIDELVGGTFSISNGGVFGSMLSTPILNPPQSAILGLHRVEPRPIAEGNQVVVRPMMYTALSYDHRIIDGREAVLFLVAIKELIEDPNRFILQV
ncbi:MAG: 2-oxoglutarate dehydrogenase complex dihydrolipoyllysine-residue succinyltransferase [Polyangiaceae bacterium]|nr:2-oxoglutarate dehydrogenase complex dihydrolipoyllysine-residue succinyltransferase [Polyangiaceae bacterium]